MITGTRRSLYAGLPETFSKVITEGEAALFAGLVGDRGAEEQGGPFSVTPAAGAEDQRGDAAPEPKTRAQHILMIGIIGGFLHSRVAGPESKCISCQFEFLAPIYTGDRIDTVIVLDHHDVDKQLATYKIDCYNQDKEQVITGQAVMLVQAE